tara:strand:- start:1958 stop:2176 length:219 start_codon:yes stop_codon:yes gene_type:complete
MGHKKRIKRVKDISKVKNKLKCMEKGKEEPICCRHCYHNQIQQTKTHLRFTEEMKKKPTHNDIFGKGKSKYQ